VRRLEYVVVCDLNYFERSRKMRVIMKELRLQLMLSPDAETELMCVCLDTVQIGTSTRVHPWKVLEAWNNPLINAP
jgi:hypothetical protein